ncbi:MAG: DUF2202 domain-containing protein [Anaerolineales bacterium]|nr:DUF2202 domain-containing protein [Anaerolineales bacterium]
MIGKLLTYGLIGGLATVLIGGSAYVLIRAESQSIQMEQYRNSQNQDPLGRGAGAESNGPSGENQSGGQSADQNGSSNRPADAGQGNGSPAFSSAASAALSADEIALTASLLEEEKLARDVYLELYRRWEYNAFQNISQSEQTHMDALISLLAGGGISDPLAGFGEGEFPTAAVQELYAQFTAMGSESLASALRAGAAIEEIDILDLERIQSGTSAPALLNVLDNLRRGSINHLQAYSAAYERETGTSYIPQYMSQEAYDALMAGAGRGARGPQGGGKGGGSREGSCG